MERLDSVLSQGVPLFVGDSVYIMLGSHDFHIISNTLIEIIRSRLRESIMSEDKLKVKEFTKKEFRETFQSLAFISSVESNSLYDRYINGKVDGLIREGIRSGLIVECGDEKTYRIYSQATISMGKIGKTMERKYIQYYIDRNKIKIAEDNAISRFDQKYGEKQMKLDV